MSCAFFKVNSVSNICGFPVYLFCSKKKVYRICIDLNNIKYHNKKTQYFKRYLLIAKFFYLQCSVIYVILFINTSNVYNHIIQCCQFLGKFSLTLFALSRQGRIQDLVMGGGRTFIRLSLNHYKTSIYLFDNLPEFVKIILDHQINSKLIYFQKKVSSQLFSVMQYGTRLHIVQS